MQNVIIFFLCCFIIISSQVMGALLMGVFLVLAVWMALFIFMKWNDKVLNKSNQENGNK